MRRKLPPFFLAACACLLATNSGVDVTGNWTEAGKDLGRGPGRVGGSCRSLDGYTRI